MAEVDRRVAGRPIEEWLAHRPDVGREIQFRTYTIGHKARALKARHVDEGHSFIEVEMGEVDGWIILNDERGLKAAMAMEFGSAPHPGFPEGTPAQYILHDASGAAKKATNPRSRRRKAYFPSRRRRRRR